MDSGRRGDIPEPKYRYGVRVPTAFGVPYLGTTRLTDADAEDFVPDVDLGAAA
jgi:hypothetical protein